MHDPRPRLVDLLALVCATIFAAFLLWLPSPHAGAASDTKGSALTATTSVGETDEIYVIQYILGNPVSRKMTVKNFLNSLNLVTNPYQGSLTVTGTVASSFGSVGMVELPSGTNTLTLSAPTNLDATFTAVMPTNLPPLSNTLVYLVGYWQGTNLFITYSTNALP